MTADPYLAARTIAAEAQLDPEFRRIFQGMQQVSANYVRSALERARDRGELAPATNLGILADMVSGAIWYRLLITKCPLDAQFAGDLADIAVQMAAAGQADTAVAGDSA